MAPIFQVLTFICRVLPSCPVPPQIKLRVCFANSGAFGALGRNIALRKLASILQIMAFASVVFYYIM